MISTRFVGLVIDTIVCLTLVKWETVSGRFGGYLITLSPNKSGKEKAPPTKVGLKVTGVAKREELNSELALALVFPSLSQRSILSPCL